jgi:hypothetical protein
MSRCVAVKTAKYRDRPSPPYHAGDCKGKTLKGNDGRKYKSVADARGVYKWVSVSGSASASASKNKTRKAVKKTTYYEIHDNYNRPFIVEIESAKKQLTVYKAVAEDETAKKWKMIRGKKIHSMHYRCVFIGVPAGNTILAEVGDGKYLYIGAEIYTFDVPAGDKIVGYKSRIGNNDFPYPVAVGEKNLYFMLMDDHCYMPRAEFDMKKDLYSQFYEKTTFAKEKAAAPKKKFAVKMISRRQV